MSKTYIYIIAPAILFVFIAAFSYSFIQQHLSKQEASIHDDKKSLFDLESHWNSGNIAILIRHAERCDRSDNACLSGNSGITVPGAQQAINLQSTYSDLVTSNTVIYNSPIKRTDQTADLIFPNKSTDKAVLRENCKHDIYDDIISLKEPNKNLILITHSTCIDHLGKKHKNKLFNFDVHDESTYAGSFFLAVDTNNKELHALGYLSSDEIEHFDIQPAI